MTLRTLISFDHVQLTSPFALTVTNSYATPNSLQNQYGVPGAMTMGPGSNGAVISANPQGWLAMSASNTSLYTGYTISFADLGWLQNGVTQGWLGFRTYAGGVVGGAINVVGFMTTASFTNNNGANIISALTEAQLNRPAAGVAGAQYVEVFVDIAANIYQTYVNGVQVANGTLPTGLNYVIFSGQAFSTTLGQNFRDFYFLDVDGTKPNGRLGPITSTPLAPSIAGSLGQNYGAFQYTVNTGATISTAQSKFGPASLQPNTSAITGAVVIGDQVSLRTTATGDVTYEWWAYNTNLAQSSGFFGKDAGGAPWARFQYANGLWQFLADQASGTPIISVANQVPVNTWFHLALVRSNGTWTLYQNGVVLASATGNATFGNNTANMVLGNTNNLSSAWQGYIDEFRMSNIARYTGAFTPPTQQFAPDANTLLLMHLDSTALLSGLTLVADYSGNQPTAFQTAYGATATIPIAVQNGADNQQLSLAFAPTVIAGQKVVAMQYKLAAQVPFAINLLASLQQGATNKALPTYQFRDTIAQYGRDLSGIQAAAPDGTGWNAANIAATSLLIQPQSTTAGATN
jgi:Concanavalin A-like lectin/glucanases superfamily